ncbi:caspase-8-like, partial [Anneissia japonica]|uniref:caspase-8-like n=1 Tax=Anneissia japonica TaxID=1529436 RepID=UPI0014254BE6
MSSNVMEGDVKLEEMNVRDEKLKNTFTELGFTVKIESDLTAEEMSTVIKNAAEEDHSNYDAFVCCILSHGNYGFVTGVDGGTCKIMDITRHLSSSNCPSLAYKPKMFIIQACQGTIHEEKVNINI